MEKLSAQQQMTLEQEEYHFIKAIFYKQINILCEELNNRILPDIYEDMGPLQPITRQSKILHEIDEKLVGLRREVNNYFDSLDFHCPCDKCTRKPKI